MKKKTIVRHTQCHRLTVLGHGESRRDLRSRSPADSSPIKGALCLAKLASATRFFASS